MEWGVGKGFVEQMQKTNIEVCYGIEQKNVTTTIEVKKPEEIKNDVDMILVTEEIDYPQISAKLRSKISVSVVSLSQFLDEIHLTTQA